MKTKENISENGEVISKNDLARFNRFYKLRCRVLRKNVFHGVKEDDNVQTIVCLSCNDTYEFHIEGRNRIEKNLWNAYIKFFDESDYTPRNNNTRPKKRWNPKYLFARR